MAYNNYNPTGQANKGVYAELGQLLETLDDTAIIARLQAYRPTGRPGYPLRTLWNAYIAAFYLNLPHTNALIRRLQDDPLLREACGFEANAKLPVRRTFNYFIARLSHHADLVEQCLARLTDELKTLLPDFGNEVAIDATAVRTHSNPQKPKAKISDPEAAWGVKHSVQSKSKDSTDYFFGYKIHMVADANYGLPIAFKVTAGNRSDSPELPAVMDKAMEMYDWFKPAAASADRGYDAMTNFEYLYSQHGIDPIIHIRKPTAADKLYDGIYTAAAVPTCMGLEPMEYVGQTGDGKRIYRCASEGCHLKDSKQGGIVHCDTVIAEDPKSNIRVLGPITRRNSREWRAIYARRWAIERLFKTLKESRRLESHCVRGLRQITLHALMATLTYQASALVSVKAGDLEWMRWMVRKIA